MGLLGQLLPKHPLLPSVAVPSGQAEAQKMGTRPAQVKLGWRGRWGQAGLAGLL